MRDKPLVILIGSYYFQNDEKHIAKNYYKKNICVANEQFEKMLFKGFSNNREDFVFVSAPRVGGFPFSSKRIYVRGFSENEHLKTVKYLSPYGLLNVFKEKALIARIKKVLRSYKEHTCIHFVACEAHRPYLEAVKYFKRHIKKESVFSTLIVPDLPSDMKKNNRRLYSFLKKRDAAKIQRICDTYIDSFLCFTEEINTAVNRFSKKHIIYEGILDEKTPVKTKQQENVHIAFIGKTDKRNGIETIIQAALLSPKTFIFDIYGSGDMEDKLKSLRINNLVFHGFVEPSKIDSIIDEADVMVSPRFPNEEYTKFSFPSKIFEYLSHHKKIVTYKLPCYFKDLDDLLFYPSDFSPRELVDTIVEAVASKEGLNPNSYRRLVEKYSPEHIAKAISDLRS